MPMPRIRVHEQWPAGTLFEPWPEDAEPADMCDRLRGNPRSLETLLARNRTLLVGMFGAFTPNCSRVHLPQYIEHAASFYAAGIDQIIVMVCNDVCVAAAWAEEHASASVGIRVLTDRNCDVAHVSLRGR